MKDYRTIFHNCLSVQLEDGVYFPVRFTQKLFQFYKDTGVAQFPARAVQTAGITLEFLTSDPDIDFDFFFTCFAREWITFDVYENDRFMTTLKFPDHTEKGHFHYQKHFEEQSKIVIYMPATADTHFEHFSFDFEPVEAPAKKYMALGCSITQGMEAIYPSITYTNIVKRHLHADLLNLGIGGFVYDPGSLDPELPFDPDIITVTYGTNDAAGNDTLDVLSRKISAYMKTLKDIYPNKAVNVITPIWRKEYEEDPAFRLRADHIRSYIEDAAQAQGFHLIDGMAAVPHSESFFKDRFLHPNDLGFALYGLYVIQNLQLD